METSVRAPIVAGAFYPANDGVLRATIESFFSEGIPRSAHPMRSSIGLIVPHAGYPYSGAVAAAGFGRAASLGRPDAVVLLGANHSGLGAPLSLSGHSAWESPLGRSPVDERIVVRLIDPVSDAAFAREHSIEVQLPLIQAIWDADLPIVPLCVLSVQRDALCEHAASIAEAIEGSAVLIVASSDFTHYEPDSTARELDRIALGPIQEADIEGFERVYREHDLSICGAGAILTLLGLCHRLDIVRGELLKYATSGDTTGDRTAVVGYASVLFNSEGNTS